MGGLLHLFHFHHGHKWRKHKKKGCAPLEAPRNSLELPPEKWQNRYAAAKSGQDLLKRSYYPNDASVKKLIAEEISKRSNNRQNGPSIVARLMGMDLVPGDAKPEAPHLENKAEKIEPTDKKVQPTAKVPVVHALKKSKSSSKKEHRSHRNAYLRYWSRAAKLGKPMQPRVHPQEEELQKFKKEFEAWQAARFLESARVVELGNIPEQWLAQLDLTKEKMARYETSRKALVRKSTGRKSKTDLLRSRSLHGGNFQREVFPASHKESYSFSGVSMNGDFEQLSMKDSEVNSAKYSSPSRIVILKPGPDSFTTNDESWVSSCSMEDRDSIQDLLEEVRQRLKSEMQGKTLRRSSTVRGRGIETPFKEKPVSTVEMEKRLSRSESIRSYQSENQFDELATPSPKFMSRDTRDFLSIRLRNILNGKDQHNIPDVSDDASRSPPFDDARERLERVRDVLNAETRRRDWNDMIYEEEAQTKSSENEFVGDRSLKEQPRPRNLVRSLSAPVSGASFGKLLLDDPFISTRAHIKRKHEAFVGPYSDVEGEMKENFGFREEVSDIRHKLSLRKKLFNRRFQSVDLSQSSEFDLNDLMSGPTILTNSNENNENVTEVPPSPVSICSSSHEEFWKPTDHPSPISHSDITSVGDQSVGNVFREISSNLTELRKQLNQLEYEGSEITTLSEEFSEPDVADLEYEAESYIKDLLTTSGLYDGSWDRSFSRWDPHIKPLNNWVFDKVEESYRRPPNDTEEEDMSYDETSLERKLLFDLLNEALSVILGPPRTLSKFRSNITDMNILPLPQGRKLLEQVWEMIREYVYPSMDTGSYSLDDLVAHDLHIMPWSNLIDEDLKDLGKELEYQITSELVEELVMDLMQV